MTPAWRVAPAGEPQALVALARAVRALRLNHAFVDAARLRGHLLALAALDPPPACDAQGWPVQAAWLALRHDQALAPGLLPRLDDLARQGHAPSARQAQALRELTALPLLPEPSVVARPVDPLAGTFEIVVDRPEPPHVLLRWTLRVRDPRGALLEGGYLGADAADTLRRRVGELDPREPVAAWGELRAWGLEPDSVVLGEVGPLWWHTQGPVLSAVSSRLGPDVAQTHIDDPLATSLALPEADAGFGMARLRKWAAPPDAVPDVKAWLDSQGSRNLSYTAR